MKKRRRYLIIVTPVAVLLMFFVFVLARAGAGRETGEPLASGNISVPEQRSIEFNATSALREEIIDHWTIGKLEDWTHGQKVDLDEPRIILGCLTAGKRIEEVNEYLMRQHSTGTSGSRWLLNKRGGYDFTAMACTPILYLFGDKPDLLYPQTRDHLLNNILTIEGDGFTRNVPRLPLQDSENHILMAEGSRYLKNQWMMEHGEPSEKYDNNVNGVGAGLATYLKEIYDYGLYEFNSDPYMGYTLSALLNLQAFAKGEVQSLSGKILDRLSWQYALGSFQFKHFPPYRRRFKDDFIKLISADYHTAMMKVWSSLYVNLPGFELERGRHHALWASLLSYRPPDMAIKWSMEKPYAYYVKIGHGHNSCPEIYSGDKDFLISGGGANQGRNSLIMPKPVVLFLDDNAENLKETFHMYGPGEDFMDWNNTGVYIDFACTPGKVNIPAGKYPELSRDNWEIYPVADSVYLAVYSENNLGIMAIIRTRTPEEAMRLLILNNPDEKIYLKQFSHPNGNHIEYDLNAPRDTWVIEKVNGDIVDRAFDRWPLLDGIMEKYKY